jgi:hypothetical protein
MKEGDLVLWQVVAPARIGKLLGKKEGLYQIKGKMSHALTNWRN